jgi:hypothetical protein
VRELHVSLLQKTQEYDAVQEVLRKLKREYKTTRQDAEGNLVCSLYRVALLST